MAENNNINIESRSDEIKRLILNSSINDPTVLSIDGLLDAFIVLYDECCNVTLRGEKKIGEFLEYGKKFCFVSININLTLFLIVRTFISRIKQSRFNRNDFETIKTIGRGAFGEGILC